MKLAPFGGHIFIFRGCRADKVKILVYDQNGMCLFYNYVASYCISYCLT